MFRELTIIYIAGYGRSGSTLLDIILGSHPYILSGGELTYLYDDAVQPNRLCSCGFPLANCRFWKNYLNNTNIDDINNYRKITRKLEELKLVKTLNSKKTEFELYGKFIENMFKYMSNRAVEIGLKKRVRFIVDSSKTSRKVCYRPYLVAMLTDFNVKLIHLQRGFTSTLKSVYKRSNWLEEGAFKGVRNRYIRAIRALLGYLIANKCAEKWKESVEYMYIEYEKLISEPIDTIRDVGEFIGLDLSPVVHKISKNECFKPQHLVGGNRLRFNSCIKIRRER